VPLLVCDAGRLRALTGWEPEIALEQTMADLLDYWRGQPPGAAPPPPPAGRYALAPPPWVWTYSRA